MQHIDEQEILELMIANYSNSKFSQITELLRMSNKGNDLLMEFSKYENRLNYYLSLTSIYHTIINISSIYASLALLDNDGGIKSPSSNPKGVSRMKLEPFVGLLIIQFQKLAETHIKYTKVVKDEKTRISKEESELKIFEFIKRIKSIREFQNLRDGSFAHPFELRNEIKVYKNQDIAETFQKAITEFCAPDIQLIKDKLVNMVNKETCTGATYFNKLMLSLPESEVNEKEEYKKIIKRQENTFREFTSSVNKPDSFSNFNLLFHGFLSYYFCGSNLVIEKNELKYKTTMKDCVFIKSLYDYSEYVKVKYLRNIVIYLLNEDKSFNELHQKARTLKDSI
ncbi:hypothetical protein AB7W18_22485 [Providencia rettgeri]